MFKPTPISLVILHIENLTNHWDFDKLLTAYYFDRKKVVQTGEQQNLIKPRLDESVELKNSTWICKPDILFPPYTGP